MFAMLLVVAVVLSSCAASVTSPAMGQLYTNLKAPFAVTSNSVSTKVGTGEVTSILGLIATGDASIQTATKSAGITKIHHIDVECTNILGIFATYTVYVYGE